MSYNPVPPMASALYALEVPPYGGDTGFCNMYAALETLPAALRERIVALATGGAAAEPGMLTSLRHQRDIATTRAALADAARANTDNIPHEMILIDLYRALWALDSLTGQTTPDDILNLIFSTFCIGK